MRVLKSIDGVTTVQLKDHLCTVCPLAKQSRLSFTLSNSCSVHPFDLVHADIWGPYRVPIHDGERYFLTLVNDFYRYTWIFL